MKLFTALAFETPAIVAFVGGGGKTTAMFRLAHEIVESGGRVITTTTTRIFAAQTSLAPHHLIVETEADLSAVRVALETHAHILITGPVDHALGKAFAIDPALVARLAQLPNVTAVLNEADGARMRPFKAPAAHEPVIPPETTHVIPVVGLDVLGEPLDEARVHRPELVSDLLNVPMGTCLTFEHLVEVLAHPRGGLKHVPPTAQVTPLLNKLGTAETLVHARQMAAQLLTSPRMTSVMLGAVREADPIREVHGRVAGIVLAAGRATRMGALKQTLPWTTDGEPLVRAVVRRVLACGLDEVIVVTGAARAEVESVLKDLPVRFAFNPDFESSEMARSLQIGLAALSPTMQATLVFLADQPGVQPAVVQAVVQRWRETRAAVAPFYGEQRGHPLLFDKAAWPALQQLPAHANPRAALQGLRLERVAVSDDSILQDVDTPEDYVRLRGGIISP